jgi:2-methylcitrate dehydratase PrpD
LALSERKGVGGREFLEALIVGYEIGIRAGEILHDHYGFYHGSGSWGAIASAAAGSKLLKLSMEQTKNALGIAEAYAPLIPEIRAVEHPAMAPKDGITWGAMVGTSATFLAQGGYTGLPSLLGDEKRNRDVFTLGKTYRMMNLYFKRYPCCRWAHPAVDGILAIIAKERLDSGEISSIMVRSFSEAVSLFTTPPTSMENAEYNLRYPVAAAAIYGEFTPKYLQEKYFRDGKIVQLMKKIRVVKDPAIQKAFPARCLGEVEVRTKGGKRYRSGVIAARGDYDYPVSEGELGEKFLLITRDRLGEKRAIKCMKLIKEFERHRTKDLIAFLK